MQPSEDVFQAPAEESIGAPTGTGVKLWLAALFGAVISGIIYAFIALPLFQGTYIHTLFFKRGLIQVFPTYGFSFGLMILVLKIFRIRKEYAVFQQDLLPAESQQLIRQEDALQCIRKLKRMPAEVRQCLLPNRIGRALVRFKLLGSAEKVDDMLKYQGELDAAAMESSYSILKFLITLLPILGFMGTVIGIGEAVSGFSGVVTGASDIQRIKSVLADVTKGLGTAFDTTLLALILSAILMLGLTIFQRIEDHLLAQIQQYCISNLLDRLWVPPLHEQVEAALTRSNAAMLRQWSEQRPPAAG
jgi:biopolymer transport protein ExbB/TolQ